MRSALEQAKCVAHLGHGDDVIVSERGRPMLPGTWPRETLLVKVGFFLFL